MALAPYFDRTTVAASQVVAGFDADAFATALNETAIGLSFTAEEASTPQGDATLDLAVRLLARLYPKIAITGAGGDAGRRVEALEALALSINPRIEFADSAEVGIALGGGRPWPRTVYAGSELWVGRISTEHPQTVADVDDPFGAGVATCLAAAALFRIVCLGHDTPIEGILRVFDIGTEPTVAADPLVLPGPAALVGNGAIGQAALWALARSAVAGDLHCVDGEIIDEGNLQRYVLATIDDVGSQKAEFADEFVNQAPAAGMNVVPIGHHWPDAVDALGHGWSTVAIAVDSAEARRQVQATLPQWVANSWTQTGDLGVSEHAFLSGACVSCLYLPAGRTKNLDEIVATALGVPERLMQVRELLYMNAPPPPELLSLIGERRGLDAAVMSRFDGVPIRSVYTAGICGGAMVSVRDAGELHVPLAHQSALAGVLLAARLFARAAGRVPEATELVRVDLMRDPPEFPFQRAGKDARGICVCQDDDYVSAYDRMWGTAPQTTPRLEKDAN